MSTDNGSPSRLPEQSSISTKDDSVRERDEDENENTDDERNGNNWKGVVKHVDKCQAMHLELLASWVAKRCQWVTSGDAKMLDALDRLRKFAPLKNSVITVLGNSGSGKEGAARAAHFLSGRRGRDQRHLVTINCAGVTETLAEAAFFGTHRGAFTDAKDQKGIFAQSNNGTVFLDEVGDLPLIVQAKLLRVLQDGKSVRVGGNTSEQFQGGVICGTNKNLPALVRLEKFRNDLFQRLRRCIIQLPPWRERDIQHRYTLINFLFETLARQEKFIPPEAKVIVDPLVIKKLTEMDFAEGNVRNLEHLILHCLIHARSGDSTVPKVRESHLLSAQRSFALGELEGELPAFVTSHIEFDHSGVHVHHIDKSCEEGRGRIDLSVLVGDAFASPCFERLKHALARALTEKFKNQTFVARLLQIGRSTLIRKL